MIPNEKEISTVTDAAMARVAAVQTRIHPLGRLGVGPWWRRQGWRGYVFQRQMLDALALDLPVSDGGPYEDARQVHHRLLARLGSIRVFWRQWACVAIGGFFCLPAALNLEHGATLYPDLAALVGAVLLLVCLAALPVLFMAGVCDGEVSREASGIVRRCFLREVPPDAPEDLRDPWRHGWLTAEARPVSSEITEADARYRLSNATAWWWIPAHACLAVGIANLVFGGLGGYFVAAVAVLKLLLHRHPGTSRAFELEAAEAVEAHAFVEAGGTVWGKGCETARERQFVEAAREATEPVVVLGSATGLLAARGDLFAPSKEVVIGLSRSDLRTHLLVLGGTGAGKTSGVLRPIARQVAAWEGTGLLVMDGKGGLPRELASTLALRIIAPASCRVSLVKGLDPVTLVETITDILEPPGSSRGDPFWRDSASILLRQSAVLAQAAGGPYWSLAIAVQVGTNATLRERLIQAVPDQQLRTSPTVAAAVEYFQYTWSALDERMRGSICTTVQTWFDVIAPHEDLLAWARTSPEEDDTPLEEVLRGGRFGLLLPAYRYGRGGAVVSALLKARIHRALKARAEGWAPSDTPVVFLIDEAQELATREDAAMVSIGRSLGLSMVVATQTKEALVEKLGPPIAAKWLGVYGSILALQGRSPETDAFIAEKIGVTWRPRMTQVEGMAVRSAIDTQAVSGVIAARRRQPSLAWFARPDFQLYRATQGVLGGLKRALFGAAPTFRPHSQLGPSPVLSSGELASLLAEPDTALAVFTRARVPRRDIIRLRPEHSA